MEGKMLIIAKGKQIDIKCALEKVTICDKFHLLNCVEKILKLTPIERIEYDKIRHCFDDEQIMIDLSKIGGSL